CPTRRSPSLVKATTDGVRRLPSRLVITTGSPPSITATTEFVVPRSIPIILPMGLYPPVLSLCETPSARLLPDLPLSSLLLRDKDISAVPITAPNIPNSCVCDIQKYIC